LPFISICDFTTKENFFIGWNKKISEIELWDLKKRELIKKVQINGTFIKKLLYYDNKLYFVNGNKIEYKKIELNEEKIIKKEEKINEEKNEEKEENKNEEKLNNSEIEFLNNEKNDENSSIISHYNELYVYCVNILKYPSEFVISAIEELVSKKKISKNDNLQTQTNFISNFFLEKKNENENFQKNNITKIGKFFVNPTGI
jgi:hypothetical protein